MARITIQDVNASFGIQNSFDLINAITNENPQFATYVPLANADNVAQVGAGIMINQTIQNDFIVNLVNRIGMVVVRQKLMQNPLKFFKKGQMPSGYTIEEIFTDIAQEYKYDPEDAQDTLFKRNIPNVKSLFHERNRQSYYPATISRAQLEAAFTSWNAFDNFITTIYNSVYNGAEVDEYKYMKLLIENYFDKKLFTLVPLSTDPTTSTGAKEFIKKVRSTAKKMSFPQGSRDWNSLAVHTRSDMDRLHLIIDADLEAEIDVDVLASAFNMNKSDFITHVTVIDGFASSGLTAVLIDYDWYMVYDNLINMESVYNAKGLYWNVFLHIWQTLSTSRFANAVAFVTGSVPAVTQVIVDPTLLSIKPGNTYEFTAYVRATDGQDHTITWSVAGSTSSTTVTGTTAVDANGVLTVDASQTGELLVTASTAFYDTTASTTLASSASAGATSISLTDASSFSVGDIIVVGTADTDVITAISSNTVTLESGLSSSQAIGVTVQKQTTVSGESIVTVVS